MNFRFEKGDCPITENKENGISFKILELILTLKNPYHMKEDHELHSKQHTEEELGLELIHDCEIRI
jgi:hypothetical protein